MISRTNKLLMVEEIMKEMDEKKKQMDNKDKKENSIHATVNNASFVGSSYQYILNSNAGKLFVISGETNDIFKVGEEVFLSINDQEVKILND